MPIIFIRSFEWVRRRAQDRHKDAMCRDVCSFFGGWSSACTSVNCWSDGSDCCHAIRSSVLMRAAASQNLITLKPLYLWLANTDPNGRIYRRTTANTHTVNSTDNQDTLQISWASYCFLLQKQIESLEGWLTFSLCRPPPPSLHRQLDGWLWRSDGGLWG